MQIALQPAQTPTAPVPSVWCPSQPHRGSFDRLHELLLCLGADRIVGVLERPAGHDRVNPPRWVPHWVPMTGPHDGNQLTHAHLINSQIPAGGVPFAMLHLAAQPKKVANDKPCPISPILPSLLSKGHTPKEVLIVGLLWPQICGPASVASSCTRLDAAVLLQDATGKRVQLQWQCLDSFWQNLDVCIVFPNS